MNISKSQITGMPSLWILWLYGYSYSFLIALVLQKLLMPIIAGSHVGYGLLGQDAIVFHDMAAAMADRIKTIGWTEWRLMPGNGITANVGLLSAIYALFGKDPIYFIPLNAGFHALGALLIIKLGFAFVPNRSGWVGGSMAALLFLIFPSALIWYGQNHKDAFLIVGFLLILLAVTQAAEDRSIVRLFLNAIYMILGCFLVAIMRPHMLIIYNIGLVSAIIFVEFFNFIKQQKFQFAILRNLLPLYAILLLATAVAPKSSDIIAMDRVDTGNYASDIDIGDAANQIFHWEKTHWLPEAIDYKLQQVSYVRAHFIVSGKQVGAGSAIDTDKIPTSAWQVAAYLPRAFWIALFAPFPDTWLERPSIPRLIGALEILFFYLMVPGIVIAIWRNQSPSLLICLIMSAFTLIVLSYTSPNVGTLHRIRFGPLFIFFLTGAIGWATLLAKANRFLRNANTIIGLGSGNLSSQDMPSASPLENTTSISHAISAGAVVTLISLIGALGFFIRDLLLVSRSNFGTPLDTYYLTIMVPMLMVTVFALPLGDTLTSTLHRIKNQSEIQSLLGIVLSISILLFGFLCLLSPVFVVPIFKEFFGGSHIDQILVLLPIAMSLFFFSGIVVASNSLLNSMNRSAISASAQLIVPLVAIVMIFFASDEHLISFAIWGMVLGQFCNLLILLLVSRSVGFQIKPSAIRLTADIRNLLQNYWWLVLTALLASLSTILNYWFAKQLGPGAVSIWAFGIKLIQIINAISISMFSAVFVPYFSKLVSAGSFQRIRLEVYTILFVGNWGGGLLALIIFGFSNAVVMINFSEIQNNENLHQLVSVIKFGSLQLPLLISGISLLKFSAVSGVSWKVAIATIIGLLVNVVLGFEWLSIWGMLGIAAASCLGTLILTIVIMVTLRNQCFLDWTDLLSVFSIWIIIAFFALAIQLRSEFLAVGAVLLGLLVFLSQIKVFLKDLNFSKSYRV